GRACGWAHPPRRVPHHPPPPPRPRPPVTTGLLEAGSLIALAAVAQWIIVYTLLEPWWRRDNQIGHNLILFALLAMVTPALLLAALWLHAPPRPLSWIEIILLFGYMPAMVWRSVIWVRASHRERQLNELNEAPRPRAGGLYV